MSLTKSSNEHRIEGERSTSDGGLRFFSSSCLVPPPMSIAPSEKEISFSRGSYLIDTNVLSEVRKGHRCHSNVAAWWRTIEDGQIYLSVLSIGEIRRGIDLLRAKGDDRAGGSLEGWFRRLTELYRDRILPVNVAIAEEWGRMNVPDPVSTVDGLLASTAKIHGLTLVTRNVRDIARTGVAHLDPFLRH